MTDIEIAHQVKKSPILEIAKKLDLSEDVLSYYGKDKAKIAFEQVKKDQQGNLILVTAVNPTPFGEGKTTVSIGLGDALCALKEKAVMVLREPSLGPVFGMKGGATGGGYSQVIPMEDINLHFTGDFHAITSANNLLAAAIDNHIKQGNALDLDLEKITFHRCLDVNDRALREVTIGQGGPINGTPREDIFTITAASEMMTLFCLAENLEDLQVKLGNIVIGYTTKSRPVLAKELKIEGALTVLLKDALEPNLVQTLENNPVIIHGGPFANIAHGCNSIIATRLGLTLADYVVTEAGFGADLGAEKFLDIKCRKAGLTPSCIVLVVTVKALKYNGGVTKDHVLEENLDALQKGLPNLEVHMENLEKYGVPYVVCCNQYTSDTDKEIELIQSFVEGRDIPFAISTAYVDGGSGAIDLAKEVKSCCARENNFRYIYGDEDTLEEKIEKITREIYRAGEVVYEEKAKEMIQLLKENHFDKAPVCIAKTQYSISDDKDKLGKPEGYTVTVKDVRLYHGAGFITVLLGDIMTMPGLPKVPNYEMISLTKAGEIKGIF